MEGRRSGKLKLSGKILLFLAFAILRSTVTKTDGTYSELRLAFHNFLTSHSFALTSSIHPSHRGVPFTFTTVATCCRKLKLLK